MGSSCCTCSNTKKYRFKDFILAVYPKNSSGDLNSDALNHLNSYVSSNPERVAPVCHKIYKLMCSHLRGKKFNRVMVSVKMLHFLIQHAAVVDEFVPDCIEFVSILLSTREPSYQTGAAGILSILCHRLVIDWKGANSRRLIADSQDRLLQPLQQICAEKVLASKGHSGIQRSYAAIIALGHIARCLRSASTEQVASRLFLILENLISVLQNRTQGSLGGTVVEQHLGSGSCVGAPPISVELPESALNDLDILYVQACSFAIGTTAGCATTTGIGNLLARITAFMTRQKAWSVPMLAATVFCALASEMQERPIRLGFMVCRALCESGIGSNDIAVHIGVLGALQAYLEHLPVSDSRPQSIVELICAVVTNPLPKDDAGDHKSLVRDMQNAVVKLIRTLLQVVYYQRRVPELQSVVKSLLCVTLGADATKERESAQGEGSTASFTFVLRCMTVASPYVRAVPLSDRVKGVLNIGEAIVSFLHGKDTLARVWAARILQRILAGVPIGCGASTVKVSMPLYTDEKDITIAQNWVHTMVWSACGITPQCVVEVANVTTAIMVACSINRIPFVLNMLRRLQQRCVCVGTQKEKDGGSPPTLGPMSALTRAWLHMIVVLLISCGRVYNIASLVGYGTDILRQRQAAQPSELSSHFESTVPEDDSLEDLSPVSGLKVAAAGKGGDIILSDDPCEGAVRTLPSFSHIAKLIVEAERSRVAAVSGSAAGDAAAQGLQAAIEQAYLQPDAKLNEGSYLSMSHVLNSMVSAAQADTDDTFTLQVPVAQLTALRSLQLTLADIVSAGVAPRVELSLATAPSASRIAAVLAAYDVNASSQLLSIDAISAPKQTGSADRAQEALHSEAVRSDIHHMMPNSVASDVLSDAEEDSGEFWKPGGRVGRGSEGAPVVISGLHQESQEYDDNFMQLPRLSQPMWVASLPSARLFKL